MKDKNGNISSAEEEREKLLYEFHDATLHSNVRKTNKNKSLTADKLGYILIAIGSFVLVFLALALL